jgi:nucleotide-binding universal stress UspA family protein
MSIESKDPRSSSAGEGSRRSAPLPSKILLATDLSARCDRALDRAATLANQWQAELVVLHAIEDPSALQRRNEARKPTRRRPFDPVETAQRQLTQDLHGFAGRFRAIVREGEPAHVIASVAAELGCELIVTGLARDETLGRFMLGTTVDRLLRRTHEPVLVVRRRARSAYQNIVVATDFSDASLGALRIAADFFPGQTLTVFHAWEPPSVQLGTDSSSIASQFRHLTEQQCAAFLERFRSGAALVPSLETWIEQGDVVSLVEQLVFERGVDLLVLGARGRSALAEVLIVGTASRILHALPCDTLIVPGAFRLP